MKGTITILLVFAGHILLMYVISCALYWLAAWTNGVTVWLIPLILFGPIVVSSFTVAFYDLFHKDKDPK